MLEFVPRFNRRFGVPPQCSEPAFRPLDPEICLEQVLCFKHRRRDNTVRFQLRTLQLQLCRGDGGSPGGAGWSAQGTPRGAHHRCSGGPAKPGIPPQRPPASRRLSGCAHRGKPLGWPGQRTWLRWSQVEPEADQPDCTDGEVAAAPPATVAPRKPTFLQRERWNGPESPAKGMSLRVSWASTGPPRSYHAPGSADGTTSDTMRNGVTFSLNTYPDIFPDPPQWSVLPTLLTIGEAIAWEEASARWQNRNCWRRSHI